VTGVSVVVSAVRGVWRDGLLPRVEFAVRRTVIHFEICGACTISMRLSRRGSKFRSAR
jgi:hypothetical protein